VSKLTIACLILVLIFHSAVLADKVVMTNGDRLTGKIIKKDGDSIIIQTESAGVVKIKWSAVAQIISEDSLTLTLNDGNIIHGKIEAEEDQLLVQTTETETITLKKQQIKAVRTPAEQSKFEIEQKRLIERKLTDFWSGTIDVGFSMTTGNSDTRTFSAGMRGVRETPNNKFTAYVNALRVNNWSSGVMKTTAQNVWSGARYDFDVNKKWFGFASGDFEYNKPQKLNIRAVLGGGAGLHAIRKDRINLDLTGGLTNNYENFSNGVKRNSAELLFGEEAKIKINPRVRFNNRFVFYPNISRLGDFRSLFDASLQTDINSWIGWHVTIGNRFNSRPVSQTEKNDFLLSTGLRISFGKNKKK
jgi:putative salt-induced outer membrane protein YdiY